MKKRILALFLTLVLTIGSLPVLPVHAADQDGVPGAAVGTADATVIVSDAVITVGDGSADFTLTIENNPGIWAILGYINYDEKMSLLNFANGTLFSDRDLVMGGPMENEAQRDIVIANKRPAKNVYDAIGASYDGVLATQVYYEGSSFADVKDDGVLVSFSLNTKDLETGTYEIAFYFDSYGFCDSDGENVPFGAIYGTLTVVECVHEYVTGGDAAEPTCTKTGSTGLVCIKCQKAEVIDALGHDYSVAVTPPTCTKDGFVTKTCCRNCGETNEVVVEEGETAYGHQYDEGILTASPTCTDGGVMTYSCEFDCGEEGCVYTEAVEALGHDEDIIGAIVPTCTEGGYSGDTVCTRCSETVVYGEELEALGHEYNAVVTEPTCKDGGYTTYTCIRCSDEYVSDQTGPVDHGWTVTSETPTRIDYKCKWCDETYFETFTPSIKITDATIREGDKTADFELVFEHNPGVYSLFGFISYDEDAEFEDYQNADVFPLGDLVEGGPMENIQMRDITVIYDEMAKAAFDEHGAAPDGMSATKLYYENTNDFSNNINSGVIGTFTLDTSELTGGTYEIAFYYMAENTIDSDGAPVEFEVIKGTLTVTPCEHQLIGITTLEPTCEGNGYKKGYCTVCEKDVTIEFYESLGHDLVETLVKETTCTEDGEIDGYCTRCDLSYTKRIEKYGHFHEAKVTRPSVTSHGYTTHSCIRCPDSYVDTYVLPLFDEDYPNMVIPVVTGELGGTVTLRVNINNNPGVNRISLNTVYDSKSLKLINAETDGAFGGVLEWTEDNVSWSSDGDCSFSGEFLELTFEIISDKEGVFTVKFDYLPEDVKNASGESVAFGIQYGSVKVYPEEMQYGDLDGNGRVAISDVLLLRKYIAGLTTDVDIFTENSDVDGTGRMTIADVLITRKYIAGLVNEFPAEK